MRSLGSPDGDTLCAEVPLQGHTSAPGDPRVPHPLSWASPTRASAAQQPSVCRGCPADHLWHLTLSALGKPHQPCLPPRQGDLPARATLPGGWSLGRACGRPMGHPPEQRLLSPPPAHPARESQPGPHASRSPSRACALSPHPALHALDCPLPRFPSTASIPCTGGPLGLHLCF